MPEEVANGYIFPTRSFGQRYDWDLLLDGRIWRCRPGIDFKRKADSFRNSVRYAARQRGLRAQTTVEADGCVVLQAKGGVVKSDDYEAGSPLRN